MRTIVSLLLILAGAPAVRAGDWPQWRGPNLDGSSAETDLPASFSKTENLAWVKSLPGTSGSTPIVLGERIFLSSPQRRGDRLLGVCLRADDGNTVWSRTLSRGSAGGRAEIAACSPCTDGERIYWLFGTGELHATDLDGELLWSRNLVADYGCFAIKFGYSASPLLHAGRLYIPLLRREKPYPYSPGAKMPYVPPLPSYVLCLDTKTGKTIWAQKRATDAEDESRETYATPMPVSAGGRTEIIIPGGEYLTAHDAATGAELWRWEYTTSREIWQRIVSSPVIAGGNVVVCQARGKATFALEPGGEGRLKRNAFAWRYDGPSSDVCTPLAYKGLLYVLAGDKKVMTCLDPADGKVVWSHALEAKGPWRASPTGADGKIYCISEGGDVVVLSAGRRFEELSRFATGARPCRASIVPAAGSLFIRLSKHILCVRKEE